MTDTTEKPRHFIKQMIEDDLASGKHKSIVTRFPPEPNGYLHIGHAKSICLNFSLAEEYQGICHLRFDDTNPIKEEDEYVQAIKEDVRWLGYDWLPHEHHASDYFDQLYDFAVHLIKQDKAYVESLTADEMREYRGTLTAPGKESPHRNRTVEENLELFAKMKAGDFKNGEHVLRAKIDMSAGNINLRDPAIYRILHSDHQRTGSAWCIYPMYDFAHALSDAIEHITHSLCTLEFQDHRPLYDWFVEHCEAPSRPEQTEFSRLNISHTITSKRKLRQLVEENCVSAWDDPRMPTLRGMRRRGYPAAALKAFCDMIGITKSDALIDMSVLEECVRSELNQTATRAMCVLNPLKVIITNFPEGEVQSLTAANHPQDETMGVRTLPFSRELYIDHDDFMIDAPKKFFRLTPGKEVRLRNAYVIRCDEVITDPSNGEITALHCHYDPDTLGKNPEGRKVKGVIHWVEATQAVTTEIRLYDRLFLHEHPGNEENFQDLLNPDSLTVKQMCYVEPSVLSAPAEKAFQFERLGYFCMDKDSTDSKPAFNRVVGLKDSWVKIQQK